MATIFRGPLFVAKRELPRWVGPAQLAPNLLVTTLAVAAVVLPFRNVEAFPKSPQHPSHRISANADTSKGMAKPLYDDTYFAPSYPEFLAPQARKRNVTDTSFRNTALLAGVVAQAPFKVPTWASVPARRWVASDTSRGMPKTLFFDAIFAPSYPEFSNPIGVRRHVTDTSFRNTALLAGVVAPPFAQDDWPVVLRRTFLPFDTSQETPKTLFGDQTPAIVNPPQFQVDRRRPVADTSRGSSLALLVTPPPVQPPFTQSHFTLHRPKWLPADTSRGTPKTLYGDQTPPFSNPPHFVVQRERPVRDTSMGEPLVMRLIIPSPPFIPVEWLAPIEYRFRGFREAEAAERFLGLTSRRTGRVPRSRILGVNIGERILPVRADK